MPIVVELEGRSPRVASSAFIAPNVVLIGDVEIGENTSVWYGAVLRADFAPIRIGRSCNIQDNVVVHSETLAEGLTIEDRVTVGHRAILHGSWMGTECLIGMGAILLSGSRIGASSFVAAGSVVLERFEVPPHTLVAGNPAVIKKILDGKAAECVARAADEYVKLAEKYSSQALMH